MNSLLNLKSLIHRYRVRVPAKVNLFLHVVGKTSSGYHLLESVFVFVALYDTLEITVGSEKKGINFVKSDTVCKHNNTIQRSIDHIMAVRSDIASNVYVRVFKNIPVSAGLAGGSADAAGIINLLGKLWNIGEHDIEKVALKVGSDVPACIKSKTAFVSGTGENVECISDAFLPKHVLLVGPNVELKTENVFSAYSREKFSMKIGSLPQNDDEWMYIMKHSRNDLEDVAISIVPEIGKILNALNALDGCFIARMSGSGSMCFALFHDEELSNKAANHLKSAHKEWYVYKTEILTTGAQEAEAF